MSVKLQIKGLSKSFEKENEKLKVLENINLDIISGEILCILGPSGCGKSTLLRQLAGLDEPDEGVILLFGKQIDATDKSRTLIFQDTNQLFPWKNVVQNVIYPLTVNKTGYNAKQRKERAIECLEMVKLSDFNTSYPYQLSGGMKQKVALARALVLSPDILLMDEPFASLDAITRNSMQNLLVEIWIKTQATIVFVTHDIQEAILLAHRIVIMGKYPGCIKKIIHNSMGGPKGVGRDFTKMFNEIYRLLEN